MSFLIHGARSLKDKRRVLKSLKSQIRARFNCSIAETGSHDMWQRAELTACVVSNESRHANEQLDEIVNFAERHREAELVDIGIELL
jgi:uncharacterized protein YlxP (DUF503 family)